MNPRVWFFGATPRRAAAESAILVFALTLPVAVVLAGVAEESRWGVLTLGGFEIGLLGGLLGALRLRRAAGSRPSRFGRELAGAGVLVLNVWLGASLANLAAALLAWVTSSPSANLRLLIPTAPVLGTFAAVGAAVAYVMARAVALAWPVWDRLRRTRLRWALTHAVLIANVTLAIVVAALLTAADLKSGAFGPTSFSPDMLRPGAGRVEQVLAWITLRAAPPAIVLVLLSLAVGVIVVAPVALIALPMLRRATRRVEDLTAAVASLRAGDLGARIPVAGEDEIARLQADFNAMATDLERAHGELRAERDAVSRLLDERRELIAAVSHELRTPVATVRGYLDSALDHWVDAPPPTLRHDLEIMTGETERLHRLIDDLFTLSRAEAGRLAIHLQPTSVHTLIERTARATAPLAWERGRVEVLAQLPCEMPPVRADPDRLEQALRNLVTNAVRHTPPGGVVLLTAESDGTHVAIQVKDTGEGIAAADLPHIWDRFYRAANTHDGAAQSREGAGLGLALVKELTEAMDGTVAVESVSGAGSCFTLRFPIIPGESNAGAFHG